MTNLIDFLEFDQYYSEEEILLRDSVRKFVRDDVLPVIEDCYREDRFPVELISKMGSLGYLGANLHGYGCAGLSALGYGLLNQELEAGDTGIRSLVSVQSSLVMYCIHTFGSEKQKEKWLPQLAKGAKVGCFALTEPDFGSNPAGMLTKAEKKLSAYILNGTKTWITNGSIADVAVVWAKLENVVKGFLVEKNTAGFSARDIKKKHSMRASITSELNFDDCEISLENILPKSGGLRSPLACLNQARFGVAWGAIGAAITCFNTAKEYAISRKQFNDKPIATHQLIQSKLSKMLTELCKAQAITLQVTRLKEKNKSKPSHISMIKMNNTEMALKIARDARAILGANGISSEYPVMRHMNNLETVVTYEGTTNIHLLTLGREITGFSAFT